MMKVRSGFTLMELILTTLLFSLILLAATSMDMASRLFDLQVKSQVEAQGEAMALMEHIVNNIQEGTNVVQASTNRLRVTTAVGQARYRRQNNDQVRFRVGGGSWDTVAYDITTLNFSSSTSSGTDYVTISITCQKGNESFSTSSRVALRNSGGL